MITEYRGYNIHPLGTRSAYVIKAKGQGAVPMSLRGEYTTLTFAKQGIDQEYGMLMSKGKGKKNAKTGSASTGK